MSLPFTLENQRLNETMKAMHLNFFYMTVGAGSVWTLLLSSIMAMPAIALFFMYRRSCARVFWAANFMMAYALLALGELLVSGLIMAYPQAITGTTCVLGSFLRSGMRTVVELCLSFLYLTTEYETLQKKFLLGLEVVKANGFYWVALGRGCGLFMVGSSVWGLGIIVGLGYGYEVSATEWHGIAGVCTVPRDGPEMIMSFNMVLMMLPLFVGICGALFATVLLSTWERQTLRAGPFALYVLIVICGLPNVVVENLAVTFCASESGFYWSCVTQVVAMLRLVLYMMIYQMVFTDDWSRDMSLLYETASLFASRYCGGRVRRFVQRHGAAKAAAAVAEKPAKGSEKAKDSGAEDETAAERQGRKVAPGVSGAPDKGLCGEAVWWALHVLKQVAGFLSDPEAKRGEARARAYLQQVAAGAGGDVHQEVPVNGPGVCPSEELFAPRHDETAEEEERETVETVETVGGGGDDARAEPVKA